MANKLQDFFKDCGTSLTGMFVSATLTDWTDEVQIIIAVIVQSIIALTTCAINVHRMWRDRDKDIEEEKKKINRKEGDN